MRSAGIVVALVLSACATPQVAPQAEGSLDFGAFTREEQARILTAHHVQNQDGELRQVHEGVRLLHDFRRVLSERMMASYDQRASLKILAEVLCRRVAAYGFPIEQQFHLDIPAGRYPVDRMHYSVIDQHVRVRLPPIRIGVGLAQWEASAFDLTGNEPQEVVSRLDFVISPHYSGIIAEITDVFAGAHLLESEWVPLIERAESIGRPLMIVHEGGRITFTLGRCDDAAAAHQWRGRLLRCALLPTETRFTNMRMQEAAVVRLNDEHANPEQFEPTPDAYDKPLPPLYNRTDVPDVRAW